MMWTVGCVAYWMHVAKWLITYRHTDASDSPMFSLTPILPMFDVRCANQPNSTSDWSWNWWLWITLNHIACYVGPCVYSVAWLTLQRYHIYRVHRMCQVRCSDIQADTNALRSLLAYLSGILVNALIVVPVLCRKVSKNTAAYTITMT